MFEKAPEDWEVVEIKKVCEFIRGTEPGSRTYNTEGIGYKFIRVSDLSKQILEPVFTKEEKDKLVFCNKDDILLALDGVPGIVNKGFEGAISSGIRIVKPKIPNMDKEFLFYILQHRIVQKIIENYTTGTTIKHASRAIDFIKIPLPPLLEQKAIAQILSTVDEAIQKVDEIIAKTERLKKGLMQKLLTKGIGHKEFKDTEIGRIPKEWEVVKVGEILSLQYGKGLPERERVFGQYPVVGSNGIVDYHTQALVKGPGIVVGRKGTIGAVSWIDRDFWPIDTTYYVKPKTTNISLRWLFYELTYLNPARFHLADVVPGLKKELVYSLKMPFPPLLEQEKIAEILSTIDKKLEFERKRKEKLEKIKKGLMNDLLTGRKRVKL
ncbi:MAG: restriction endonuclease subunit S [Candidatus Aenigmatarchaeota archaeon]